MSTPAPPVGVPGPPRARPRQVAGGQAARLAQMRVDERGGDLVTGLASLVKDVGWTALGLLADPRVPRRAKAVSGGAPVLAGLLARGVWRLPGGLVAAMAGARHLLRAAGYRPVYEQWRGTEEGLTIVVGLLGIDDEEEDLR